MRWLVILLLLTLPASATMFRGGTGGTVAPGSLVQLQAINSGSTQTNVPFSVGVPFDVSVMDGSHHIVASDPTNGTLVCDETNRYSDIGGRNSGTPQVRGTTLSCNMPSWPNGTNNISLSIAAGAPGSGTDITTSDLTTANFDLTATIVTQAGTTETAQISAAFANVGFVNITTPAVLGKWRSGGGINTGYIVFIPFKNGGTADPKGLYGLFDVECYKAATAAVNVSTNPITSCHVDLLTGAGVAELSSPLADDYSLLGYGISFAGGAGGTTTCTDWAATSPTQTLTFTNISSTATITPGTPGLINWNTGLADPNAPVLADNQTFILSTNGSLAGTGFTAGTPYALRDKSFSGGVATITAAATIGGTKIDSAGAGTGTHTIWPQTIGTVTANSALWTSDSKGSVISDGTFYGVITNITSGTVADVSIYRPITGLTTLTSGNYKLLPINHPYLARMRFGCDWVNTGTAAPLRMQNGNLYLGNAWDDSAHTGGPGPYFRTARAMPNYNIGTDPTMATFAAEFANCPPSLNLGACVSNFGNNSGTNPSAYGSLATSTGTVGREVCGGTGTNAITNGPFIPDQQASGDNGQIYMHPSWNVGGMFLYDQYAYKAIFEKVDKFAFQPINTISNTTGVYPASDVNSYNFSGGGVYTRMAAPSGWLVDVAFGWNNSCWFSSPNAAHAVNQFALPYQLTGDWYILTHELNNAFGLGGLFPTVTSKGLDLHWVGADHGNDERSGTWPFMIQADFILFLPDSDTSTSTDAYKVLGGLTKTDAITWQTAQWLSTGGGAKDFFCFAAPSFFECPGTTYGPGVNASCPAGGSCNPYFTNVSTPDLRFYGGTPAGFGFETGYWYNVFNSVFEKGMCDANCKQAYLWIMQGQSSYVTNTTDLGSPIAAATTEHLDNSHAPDNPCNWYGSHFAPSGGAPTWACAWRAAYVTGYVGATETGIARYPSGTATLSATTGTITVTIPTGYIASGGTAFYADGFFITSDNGYCKITTVNSATQFGCTVINTFGTTSYVNTSVPSGGHLDGVTLFWEIPQPYGGDLQGLEAAYLVANGQPGAGGFHYANIQQAGCIAANQNIAFPITSTCNTIKAFTPTNGLGNPSQADPITFNIVAR